MDLINRMKNFCAPAIIYLGIGLLGVLSAYKRNDMIGVIVEIIVVILLAFLFDYVCKEYGQNISWYGLILIVILPYILSLIMFYSFMRQIKKK